MIRMPKVYMITVRNFAPLESVLNLIRHCLESGRWAGEIVEPGRVLL
jgi:hypothetical protein